MVIRDEHVDLDLTLTGDGQIDASSAEAAQACESCDWQERCLREQARADALQATNDGLRAENEALRRSELDARTRLGGLRSQVTVLQSKLGASRAEAAELRRTAAKDPLAQQAEVERLRKLLADRGVESSRRGTMVSLRTQVGDLQAKVAELERELRGERAARGRTERRLERQNEREAGLRAENRGLRTELRRERSARRKEVEGLRQKFEASQARIAELEGRVSELEARVSDLEATKAIHAKARFGSKSEKSKKHKKKSKRKRGQQRGKTGHGRTKRSGVKEKPEVHDPPEDERVCQECGQPYTKNGFEQSTLFEIQVRVTLRRIIRTRWRRGCKCHSSPQEAVAPAVSRLFKNTLFGLSVWVRYLYERFACLRPLRQVANWLTDNGLPISAGTLANHTPHFIRLFKPIRDAIRAYQNEANVLHGDETSWHIGALRELAKSARAWLWASATADSVYCHIDPSRSAEVAKLLFCRVNGILYLVCDRFSSYKKLARDSAGLIILCLCWAHQRRSFDKAAQGCEALEPWRDEWRDRIAEIYRLNKVRKKRYKLGRKRKSSAYAKAQAALEAAVGTLFETAQQQLAELGPAETLQPQDNRKMKALNSLLRHREGLSVFLKGPEVPMDNNLIERILRRPAMARKLSFGSDSKSGALLTAIMYSVFGTLQLNEFNILRWTDEYLHACAENGGKPPDDLTPWLPWTMSPERKQRFMAPD